MGGHRGKAAALLGIDPKTLYRKILSYGITPDSIRILSSRAPAASRPQRRAGGRVPARSPPPAIPIASAN